MLAKIVHDKPLRSQRVSQSIGRSASYWRNPANATGLRESLHSLKCGKDCRRAHRSCIRLLPVNDTPGLPHSALSQHDAVAKGHRWKGNFLFGSRERAARKSLRVREAIAC